MPYNSRWNGRGIEIDEDGTQVVRRVDPKENNGRKTVWVTHPEPDPPPTPVSPPVTTNTSSSHVIEIDEDGSQVDDKQKRDKKKRGNNQQSVEPEPYIPPDLEDMYEDEFDTLSIGQAVRSNLHLYANPDALFLMRDFETRPLTIQTLFKIKSPMDALDFLYSDTLNLTLQEIQDVVQMYSVQNETGPLLISNSIYRYEKGWGGYSIDMVEDFAGTSFEGEISEADVLFYHSMLESTLKYDLRFDENKDYSTQEKFQQLQTLAQANLHIVAYLDKMFKEDDSQSGLSIFQQYFSQTGDGEQIIVELGNNVESEGSVYGRVPLPSSTEDPNKLKTIYLGSEISVATTIHEFFHQLDRHFDEGLSSVNDPNSMYNAFISNGIVFNQQVRDQILQPNSDASEEPFPQEIFADLAMTSVVSENDIELYVNSDGTGSPVGFRQTNQARLAQEAILDFFRILFSVSL